MATIDLRYATWPVLIAFIQKPQQSNEHGVSTVPQATVLTLFRIALLNRHLGASFGVQFPFDGA